MKHSVSAFSNLTATCDYWVLAQVSHSVVSDAATLSTAARQASLSITNSWSLLKLMSMSQWCHPTISSCHPLLLPPSIFPSIRVFSNESTLLIRWPKYWSFSLSISPSNEHLGLISFRMDWLDLLAVQGTRKSLLHHHSSKASILQCSAFFTVQLSHPYMTTGKTIALTRWTFVGKVMSLLFNMLSKLVITFLQQASFNFMTAVTICSDFGAPQNKVSHCFHCLVSSHQYRGKIFHQQKDYDSPKSQLIVSIFCSNKVLFKNYVPFSDVMPLHT